MHLNFHEPSGWVARRTGITPTAPAGRRSAETVLDEATRPTTSEPGPEVTFDALGLAAGRHLVQVHDMFRGELAELHSLLSQVRRAVIDAGEVRGRLQEMALRANDWTLGGYCQAYCSRLTGHHTLESDAMFPHLRREDAGLAPVVERLDAEHEVIHDLLERVDAALVHLVRNPGDHGPLTAAIDLLSDTASSHFAYEERELIAPLSRFGFYPGQL
jgi:hypothetical protein